MSASVTIRNFTKGKPASLPFKRLAEATLGGRYHISLVFVGDVRARKLNQAYRKKNYVPNVLAFPLGKHEGEIVINPRKARKESKSYGMSVPGHLAHLFIHGCLHLKGLKHGATMESIERRLLRRFNLS